MYVCIYGCHYMKNNYIKGEIDIVVVNIIIMKNGGGVSTVTIVYFYDH
jgi:hypothetical protein